VPRWGSGSSAGLSGGVSAPAFRFGLTTRRSESGVCKRGLREKLEKWVWYWSVEGQAQGRSGKVKGDG